MKFTTNDAANPAITNSSWPSRLQQSIPASYTIWYNSDDSKYYGESNIAGVADIAANADAATVIQAAWANMALGGVLFLKGSISYSTGLAFNLLKEQKGLWLIGEGTTGTKLNYSGTGAAITISTTDAPVGYYDLCLRDFRLDGVSLTAGRNGINIDKMGRTATFENLKIDNFDVGLDFDEDDNNVITLKDVRINVANTGIKIGGVANEFTMIDTQTIWTTNYGIFSEDCGRNVRMLGGTISPDTGYGAYLSNATNWAFYGTYFHGGESAYNGDIYLTGADGGSCESVLFSNCYFTGNGNADYAIKAEWVRALTIEAPRSRYHDIAFLYLYDQPQHVSIVNPIVKETGNDALLDPYLLDGTLTKLSSRLAGTVISNQTIGEIIRSAPVTSKGDVLYMDANGCYTSWNPAGNDNDPAVILFGSAGAIDKPAVIAVGGFAQVNCEAAVTSGDTLVVADGAGAYKLAEVNNAQTDPKKIIGYAVETIVGAGLVWTRIK